MFRRKLMALGHPNPTANFDEDLFQKKVFGWVESNHICALKQVIYTYYKIKTA